MLLYLGGFAFDVDLDLTCLLSVLDLVLFGLVLFGVNFGVKFVVGLICFDFC